MCVPILQCQGRMRNSFGEGGETKKFFCGQKKKKVFCLFMDGIVRMRKKEEEEKERKGNENKKDDAKRTTSAVMTFFFFDRSTLTSNCANNEEAKLNLSLCNGQTRAKTFHWVDGQTESGGGVYMCMWTSGCGWENGCILVHCDRLARSVGDGWDAINGIVQCKYGTKKDNVGREYTMGSINKLNHKDRQRERERKKKRLNEHMHLAGKYMGALT